MKSFARISRRLSMGNPSNMKPRFRMNESAAALCMPPMYRKKMPPATLRGWVSAISDITDRKQTEEMLRQRTRALEIVNQEFRKLIDTAPIGIAVATDAECEHIWCNPEFTRMLGTNIEENVSKSSSASDKLPFRMLRNGQQVAANDLPMQRACREGIDILDEELEILRSDGTIIHELCRATPLREEEGKVRGCIGIFLNITDRKEAEEALQQAKDELARANEELEKRVQHRTAELQLANAALSKERDEEKRLEQQLRQAQRWKASEYWQAASPMISTIFSISSKDMPRFCATTVQAMQS